MQNEWNNRKYSIVEMAMLYFLKPKIYYKIGETFSALIRLISERNKKYNFQKGESQWMTVQVTIAVSLMVMTMV